MATKIEWTDATWNPITGCSIVSKGCTNCYAMRMAGTRLKNHSSRKGLTVEVNGHQVWTGEVRFNPGWLTQPLHWRKPRMIFVCAHGDLFHEKVPDAWIDQVFAVMALCPQHTFQVLTKRPERMREYLTLNRTDQHADVVNRLAWDNTVAVMKLWAPNWSSEPTDGPHRSRAIAAFTEWPLPNVWLGTSIEDQDTANDRIPILLDTPAAKRFISAEPLLGPVNFGEIGDALFDRKAIIREAMRGPAMLNYDQADDVVTYPQLDWVIVGGESGPKARPMHPQWARDIRDQCALAEVPFFFKQWGSWVWSPDVMNFAESEAWAVDTMEVKRFEHHSCGRTAAFVGKAKAGRLLDGIEHSAMPTVGGDL